MKILTLLICCVFLSSCATIFTSGKQHIGFYTSDAKPATVRIIVPEDGEKIVNLPNKIKVKKSSDDIIVNVLEDDLTKPSMQIVKHGITPVFLLNAFFPIFALVDLASKKMWSFEGSVIVEVNRKNQTKINFGKE